MFSRASSLNVFSRSCRYLLRPNNNNQRASFSLTARSHAAINAAMADTSGITADSLKNKLTESLQAQHVEVEDLSGMEIEIQIENGEGAMTSKCSLFLPVDFSLTFLSFGLL